MLGIFSMKDEIRFPENYVWGSATAGHQIEGDNIHSSNWHREQAEHYPEPSGKACNFWNLWKEDTVRLWVILSEELCFHHFRARQLARLKSKAFFMSSVRFRE